jgi:hypothetical protein
MLINPLILTSPPFYLTFFNLETAFHTISNEAEMDSRMEMLHSGKFITTRRLSYDQLVQESQGSYSDDGEKNEKAYYMSLFFRNYW